MLNSSSLLSSLLYSIMSFTLSSFTECVAVSTLFGLNNSFSSVSVNNDLSNKLIPSSFTIYTSFNDLLIISGNNKCLCCSFLTLL